MQKNQKNQKQKVYRVNLKLDEYSNPCARTCGEGNFLVQATNLYDLELLANDLYNDAVHLQRRDVGFLAYREGLDNLVGVKEICLQKRDGQIAVKVTLADGTQSFMVAEDVVMVEVFASLRNDLWRVRQKHEGAEVKA